MNQIDLSEKAWDNRYKSNDIGWDLGAISPPLKHYIDQLENKEQHILIPGGGNSYEAEYLFRKGFQNVFVADLSKTALRNLQKRVPEFPEEQLLHMNFFEIEASYDLVFEQTFFCAIHPTMREDYALKMQEILQPKGKIVGVLFQVPLFANRPPFGGSKAEYLTYFKPQFQLKYFDTCYNSHPSRKGKELFINLIKK